MSHNYSVQEMCQAGQEITAFPHPELFCVLSKQTDESITPRAVTYCGKLCCLAADDMLLGTPTEINIRRSVLVARHYQHTPSGS